MAALKNPRHEMFAQLLVEGKKHSWSNGACYSRAGFKAEGRAAEANASRLLSNANSGIAARVQEIVEVGAKRAEVTVTSLLNELDAVLAGATDDRQWSAARAAIVDKGRLKGLFIEKLEVGGPNAFALCETPEAVAKLMLAERSLSDILSNLEELRETLIKVASEGAIPVN